METKTREMSQKRAELKVEAEGILERANKATRKLTPEENHRYNQIQEQMAELHIAIRKERDLEYKRKTQSPKSANIGMNAAEIRRYSLLKAIRASISNDWSKAGLEKEASQTVTQQFGRSPRSFFIPNDVFIGEKRDMTVGTPTAGGYLVGTEYPLPMIELLVNRLALAQAGITILDGLVGDFDCPKQTGGGTSYWVGEGGGPTEGGQTVGQVGMTPHTIGAYVDVTRRLVIQTGNAVENFVRADLARSIALSVDYAGLHGDDSIDANQPDGIASISGIGSVVGGSNGAAPTWDNMVDLETEVAQDNADVGSSAYVTNAKVRAKLKKSFKNPTYGDKPIWDGGDLPLNDNRAVISNQASSTLTKGSSSGVCSAIFYGAWSELVLGLWGDGVDILVDPVSLITQGGLRIVAFQDIDFAVRHVESFSAMLDALTA